MVKKQKFNNQVWLLATGRFLSQIGTGFTLFYAPLFFVNQVGLSPTLVGVGLSSASISGVVGRFLGGSFCDSPQWGRRRTLLLSALISAVASVILALTYNFLTLVIGNLLLGLGVGLYWPATEAVVADLTTREQRNEAFAVTRLADSLGLSIGIVLGGALISLGGNYRILFLIDGISFLVFFALVYKVIKETYSFFQVPIQNNNKWSIALRDRNLIIYISVNILFTTYIAQIQSTMPLYFSNFISSGGFSTKVISLLFTWHITWAVLLQIPIMRLLNRYSRTHNLMLSMLLWCLGFALIWLTGIVKFNALFCAFLALGIFAIAIVSYTPSASALVVDLSPDNLRGIYLSLNSQCWAIGYFVGPALGGWVLDQSPFFVHSFWLAMAVSVVLGIFILHILEQRLNQFTINN
jgi:MFS family permease